ncbi:hypothetical protein WAI453_005915 [Rhynchosporium graminicola]|uniref:Uncharacterized protein n=1 Tax=Rhynchosporium graminicola TaxID=2792576 RepID=A0A1E1LR63_9HELO|nr:uncharacterized protein RCO7_04280 [Rhynchosporium commune]
MDPHSVRLEGIDFGRCSSDETPTAKRHQQFEPSSYGLLIAQQEHKKLRDEIKTEFLDEEGRKFHRSMTAAYKKTARREAILDLQEDNRKELVRLKMKLEAELLGKRNQQVEALREKLREKDTKIKELEVEASEDGNEIRRLQGVVALMMAQVNRLKNNERSGDETIKEN